MELDGQGRSFIDWLSGAKVMFCRECEVLQAAEEAEEDLYEWLQDPAGRIVASRRAPGCWRTRSRLGLLTSL